MRIARLVSLCFLTLFLFSGKSHQILLNLEKVEKKFPYGKLKHYRISDTLKLSQPMNNELFLQFFQQFTSAPPANPAECGCAVHEQIFKGLEYMLGNHGRACDRYSNDSVDVVTVLTKYKGKSAIYFLCYAAADWGTNELGFSRFKKGQVTRPYLGPALAEKYQTDSTTFESYSEFYDDNTFRKTSVLKSKSGICLDSTIQVFSMDYTDMAVMEDNARYINGKLEHDFLEKETNEK